MVFVVDYMLSGQGYGKLDCIPAVYGLQWCSPALIQGKLDQAASRKGMKTMLRHGYGAIWKACATQQNINIVSPIDIIKITRHQKRRGGVVVTALRPGGNGQEEKHLFDYVIFACPPDAILSMLDCTPAETDVLTRLHSSVFRTTLYERQPGPSPAHEYQWPYKGSTGSVQSMRDSFEALQKGKHTGTRRQVAYQLVESRSEYDQDTFDAEFKAWTRQEKLNVKILRVINHDYFWRFNMDDLAAGYQQRVLDLQGRNHTLFVHAFTTFESCHDVVNYCDMLFEAFYMAGKHSLKRI